MGRRLNGWMPRPHSPFSGDVMQDSPLTKPSQKPEDRMTQSIQVNLLDHKTGWRRMGLGGCDKANRAIYRVIPEKMKWAYP